MTCERRELIDRHFEATISQESERLMREHIPACDACHRYYERRLLLQRLDPAAPTPEARLARGLGLEPHRPRVSFVPPRVALAATATLVAVAAALVLWVRSGSEGVGFTARGGAAKSATSRVLVYDVRPGKPAELASGSVGRGDELAFAYENGAAKNRLMIFGVDEHRHVYWFYPAWVNESENPVAIPIEHDVRRHELPEAVRQRFDGARLEIRSLFVDSPVTVTQVEAMLRENPAGPLPIPGAVEPSASFVIAP